MGAVEGGNADHAGFDPELPIDWLEPEQLGDALPGRLGLTVLPGKQGISFRYPGRTYRRDVGHDFELLRAASVARLILLVEDAELRRWSDPLIVERGSDGGVEVIRHPIPDGRPPASTVEMESILAEIREGRASGSVAVACMGGVGRTGTIAACALVEGGMNADDAIATVRAVRHPGAVETAEQERFVHSFADARQRGERS
ncbi:MAG TPA: protein-tyrosine phosphatase family protein [Candidatus Limnocylindria bacterium]|nr:protein-tyrosine phosphatase family protein [Candidatus Limnocylindria bacterium]